MRRTTDFGFQVGQKQFNRWIKVHGIGLGIIVFFYCIAGWSIALPNNLTRAQGEEFAASFAFQNIHHMNGPANSIGVYPGIYPGIEFLFLFPPDLERMKIVNNGQLPLFMPVPRLFLTKGLPLNLDLNFHFLPMHVMPAYHGWGGSLKWTLFPEKISFAAFAVKVSYDHAEFILNSLKTNTFQGDLIVSQDLVDFIPYLGLGVIQASSAIEAEYMASGLRDEFSQVGVHFFGGLHIKTPLTFNLETGFSSQYAYVGFSVGKNLFDQLPEDQMQ